MHEIRPNSRAGSPCPPEAAAPSLGRLEVYHDPLHLGHELGVGHPGHCLNIGIRIGIHIGIHIATRATLGLSPGHV